MMNALNKPGGFSEPNQVFNLHAQKRPALTTSTLRYIALFGITGLWVAVLVLSARCNYLFFRELVVSGLIVTLLLVIRSIQPTALHKEGHSEAHRQSQTES